MSMDSIYSPDRIEPLLLNTKQASQALGISQRYLQQLTSDGGLPHVRLGRRVLFDPADLRRWIAANKK